MSLWIQHAFYNRSILLIITLLTVEYIGDSYGYWVTEEFEQEIVCYMVNICSPCFMDTRISTCFHWILLISLVFIFSNEK